MEYMSYNQKGVISTLNGDSLKSVDKFLYLGSSVSSTEDDINIWLSKARAAIDRLSILWKSNLSDKIKHNFFQASIVSILLYGRTTWTLTKRIDKMLDENSMLRVILKQQLYGLLPSISKTIQIRRTRHVGHCWRSKNKFTSDVLLWTHFTRTCKCWTTKKKLFTTAMYGHGMQSRRPAGSDRW